jgi:hypothetical protein
MGDRTQLRRIECEWEGFQHAALWRWRRNFEYLVG